MVVTRNRALAVKTLHTLLKINIMVIKKGHHLSINFVNDNVIDVSNTLPKLVKNNDRVVFINYSVCLDDNSIDVISCNFPAGYNGVVFPTVKQDVDWDMFRTKVNNGVDEPNYQMGLNFDTEVNAKLTDEFWSIKSTSPIVWVVDSKSFIKEHRNKKGEGIKVSVYLDEIFTKIKFCAYVKAKVVVTYTHECLGNILECAGVSKAA